MLEKFFNIIAFDFGTKKIGVAVGQKVTCTARSLTCCNVYQNQPDWRYLSSLMKEWDPKIAVVGFPMNMDRSKRRILKKIKSFSKSLQDRFHIPVILYDERLSTFEAKSILFERFGFRSLSKEKIDAKSAELILESWMRNILN